MDQLKPSPANSSPPTPLQFLERAAIVYADSTSIIYNTTTYTWSQTHRRCLQLASSLSSLGIKPGQVVSVIAPNIPAMYEVQFAVPMCGAVLNTLNTRLDAKNISVLLQHCKSKLVLVDHLLHKTVQQALSMFADDAAVPVVVVINTDNVEQAQGLDYEGMIERGDAGYNWVKPASDWTPMVLNYTSGTTSSPKGAVHCHRGLFIMTVESLIDWSVPKQPVYLWTLPMFHTNGWSFSWGMAAVGGTNVCLRKFDAASVHSHIRRYGVTHMCGAPVVLNMLVNAPNPEPLPHPVHFLTAGASPPASVLMRTEELGFIVGHGYGLTETCGIVASCPGNREWNQYPPSERARLRARQGVRTNAMAAMDVVDSETGLSVRKDGVSIGEVVVRGACVMLGYLNDPVETNKCMKEDGWFYTGDLAVIHPDGYMEIKDRAKDVIISGGENISSLEVESILYLHPSINEAAVVARPDEFWGETPCAFVSVKPQSKKPTEKEVHEFCKSKMPRYMVPKTVVFVPSLPKSSTGKILKFSLREHANALGRSHFSRL